jgi:Exopolyphosphatase-related proteins
LSKTITLIEAAERLKNAQNVLLLCHKSPDGDTLGSAFALFHALKTLGKNARVFCSDDVPKKFEYLTGGADYSTVSDNEYIVAVDVAVPGLLGIGADDYADKVSLNIDHHRSNNFFAEETCLDDTAAATAEIIIPIIDALGVEITPTIADCLYTGISTDTGCFRFVNTTAETHILAARTIEAGADYDCINNNMFERKTRDEIKLESLIYKKMRLYFDGRVAVSVINNKMIRKLPKNASIFDGVSGLTRRIDGVLVGITLREDEPGVVKASVRTGGNPDACAICSALGGGGHKGAAGATIKGSLGTAKKALLAEIEKIL